MLLLMNATAQASAAPIKGPRLDNRRVLAAIVDLAVVVAGAMLILFAAHALSSDTGDVRGALSAVTLGWVLYYYFALESGHGQTLGKKLLKLRVVRADGRPAGMAEIAVRTVLRVIDGVGGYIVGLIVMLATGQRRQRLGDLAAGTIVVDASAPAHVPQAAIVAAVDEASIEDEPVEDEAEPQIASYMQPPTITLPSRPAAPATVDDLSAPEAPPVADEAVDEPIAAEALPEVSTPSLEELAHDVEAARTEPDQDDAPEDEPMSVKPVETVSAIDLVMGGGPEEDSSSKQDHDVEPPAAS